MSAMKSPVTSPGRSSNHESKSTKPKGDSANVQRVMNKYVMYMDDSAITGEGTSSICRKGEVIDTKETLAIKVYKTKKAGRDIKLPKVIMKKFLRQIDVLQELTRPFKVPLDSTLWCDELAHAKPSRLFLQLVDFSKNQDGTPGRDPTDGVTYIVTELASYSLKDYISARRKEGMPLSKDTVCEVTKAMVLVTAGLHAKGLVHLDIKPENLMLFKGCLKLIDVDGCVKIGTRVSISDDTLSFSPCYCAPEWAGFLISEDDEPTTVVSPALDVWSIGMSIVEVVILDQCLRGNWAAFMKKGSSHREGGFLFMDWLSNLTKPPLPSRIGKVDPLLEDLLLTGLMTGSPAVRSTLAQSLSHPFFKQDKMKRHTSKKDQKKSSDAGGEEPVSEVALEQDIDQETSALLTKQINEDRSKTMKYQGKLWLLDAGTDEKDLKNWVRHDFYLGNRGDLCYFDSKTSKRLILVEFNQLLHGEPERLKSCERATGFKITTAAGNDWDAVNIKCACDTEEELDVWLAQMQDAKVQAMQTMRLGQDMATEMKKLRITVKNRRIAVSEVESQPVFKAKLWKVKADGNCMKPEDWFEREMWLAKNGSLAYHSVKDGKDLVYYTTEDVSRATLSLVAASRSARPFTFQVQLPPSGDIEYAPGEFAAESEEMREKWIEAFREFKK